jgi:hypothetical protein
VEQPLVQILVVVANIQRGKNNFFFFFFLRTVKKKEKKM